jgi:ATP-binding cassette, subfamily B, multidrug efflux pump
VNVFPTTLAGQFRRHLPRYLLGALCLGTFQYAMNRMDWASKRAVDAIFDTQADKLTPIVTLFVLGGVALVVRVLSRWFIFNAGRDVEYELRSALLEKLLRLGAAFYRKLSAGDIMSRATNDLLQVRLLFGFGILNIANVVFAFASALQVLLTINARLTAVSFIVLPIIIGATRAFSKRLFSATRKNQDALSALSSRIQSNLAGIRVVRSFAVEDYEEERFRIENDGYLEASLSLARLRGLMGPIAGMASAMGILAFFWYGGVLLLRGPAAGGITKGDFFAFWLALGRMTWPIVALGFSVAIIQRGRAGFARLQEIFEAVPEVVDGDAPALPTIKGAIEVKGLSFKFAEREVLKNVSFTLEAGKSLAIIGRTGSGKSTLASLLARLLPTPKGTVFLDHTDVCSLPVVSVRAQIGYAQQDAFLFSSTVAENVAYSLPDDEGTRDAVEHAARDAEVYDEVLGLPEQWDTVVGERGVQLSGGQKQRLSLARALARKPPILVLDDPLSAVDTRTEAAILQAIERQKRERTLILVTHRIAAASRCDHVIVLERGEVIEAGTPEALAAQGGLYARFALEQEAARALEELSETELAS